MENKDDPLLLAEAEEKINVEFEKIMRDLRVKFPELKNIELHVSIWKTFMREGFRLGYLHSNNHVLKIIEESKNVPDQT